MAVKTATNYYSNAIVGTPQIGADVNVLETHTVPRFAVGTGFERQDGAKFRYVQYGANVEAGSAVSQDLDECGIAITGTNVIIQTESATSIAGEIYKPGSPGSHYVEAYLTAGRDQFAGGYLSIAAVGATRAGKAGYTYRIRGNTAAVAGGGTKTMLNLYEPLKYELGTETCFGITGNPWCNVESATYGTDPLVSGICCAAASSTQYGWVCAKGIATAAYDGTVIPVATVGAHISLSTATAGALGVPHVLTNTGNAYLVKTPFLGSIILTGSNGTFTCINLSLM